MKKNSENRRIKRKIREWDEVLGSSSVFIKKITKLFKVEFGNMIDFLLFYKSKNKLDKAIHIFEVICIYVVLQFSWIGMFGGR